MEFTTTPEANMTRTEQIATARNIVGEQIARMMSEGATYEQATRIAFTEINERWPILTAGLIAAA